MVQLHMHSLRYDLPPGATSTKRVTAEITMIRPDHKQRIELTISSETLDLPNSGPADVKRGLARILSSWLEEHLSGPPIDIR